mmetsp:Transcript_18239/g.51334  ORF Transcript_18239/g.51334 Transcript_18239/m.51334 type:complete len:86 (-) Transcript_18239:167-424(-)
MLWQAAYTCTSSSTHSYCPIHTSNTPLLLGEADDRLAMQLLNFTLHAAPRQLRHVANLGVRECPDAAQACAPPEILAHFVLRPWA